MVLCILVLARQHILLDARERQADGLQWSWIEAKYHPSKAGQVREPRAVRMRDRLSSGCPTDHLVENQVLNSSEHAGAMTVGWLLMAIHTCTHASTALLCLQRGGR